MASRQELARFWLWEKVYLIIPRLIGLMVGVIWTGSVLAFGQWILFVDSMPGLVVGLIYVYGLGFGIGITAGYWSFSLLRDYMDRQLDKSGVIKRFFDSVVALGVFLFVFAALVILVLISVFKWLQG